MHDCFLWYNWLSRAQNVFFRRKKVFFWHWFFDLHILLLFIVRRICAVGVQLEPGWFFLVGNRLWNRRSLLILTPPCLTTHLSPSLSCPHSILLLTQLQKTQIQKLFSPYSHPALSPTPSLLLFQSRAVVFAFNAKLLFPFSKPTIHPYTKQVNYARSHCFVLILTPPSCQLPPSCPHYVLSQVYSALSLRQNEI